MRRWLTRVAVLTAGATLGFGGVAAAAPHTGHSPADDTPTSSSTPDTPAAPAVVAASSTVTLPLFGAPLTVDVSTDPSGQLASVAVNPADGFTAVVDRPNKVSFVNADGTAKVRVEASRRGQSVAVKGTTIADISGPGGWSGDPFGTGATTKVSFTIAAAADGGPDITGVSSSDATAKVGDTQHHTGRFGSEARAAVTFSSGGQQRTLWITAIVSQRDETSRAALSVSLSKVRGVAQDAVDAVGTKTWSGMLCDGTAATITYTVATDGSLSDVSATPTSAEVKVDGNHADVRFTTGERIRIGVRATDAQLKVSIDQRFRCDVTDPSVNTPTSTVPADDHGNHDGNHDGDHRPGDDPGRGHDDSTPATSTVTTTANSTATTTATTTVDGHGDSGHSGSGRGSGDRPSGGGGHG